MSHRFRCSLSPLALVSVVALAGCQTMAPAMSSASAGRPRTLCDAPSLQSQCNDLAAIPAMDSGPVAVVGNAMVTNPLSEAIALLGVRSSADVAIAVRVMESPSQAALAIVDPDEKYRVAVLRAALSKVKSPLVPRTVAIVVKDPSRYTDLQARATALGLHLWLVPASRR